MRIESGPDGGPADGQLREAGQHHVQSFDIAVGNVSFDDCDLLTSSFGWIGAFEPMMPPAISMARFEMTSLAFMLVCVPEPVCQTRSGKCASSLPSITSSAA